MSNIHRITSEGEMEIGIKLFTTLALSKKKKKVMSFWFATEAFSIIFLDAAYTEFAFQNIQPQSDIRIHIYIGEDDEAQ